MTPRPFLKWVGGKRQLLAELLEHAPKEFGRFYEPFVGGGALFFRLNHSKKAVLGDSNLRLIRTYRGVQTSVDEVIERLGQYKHDREFFEQTRSMTIDEHTDPEVAAWFIYLNRAGYNGLYRVNSKNVFNVPFGDYAKPRFCQPAVLRACAKKLQQATLRHGDFEEIVSKAKAGDFVYFDPPYWPLSETSSFTSYTSKGFGPEEQTRLRDVALKLKERGVHVLLSNSSAKQVRELYRKDFDIIEVRAARAVNSKGSGRGKITELLMK